MKHKAIHRNVMFGITDLMDGEKADIFYCDPPWGQGLVRKFYTMNKQMTGSEQEVPTNEEFLKQVFIMAKKHSNGVIIIEYGIKWYEQVKQMGTVLGLNWHGLGITRYKGNGKLMDMHIHVFSIPGIAIKDPKPLFKTIASTTGYATTLAVVDFYAKAGGILLDPCCGLGLMARATLANGMVFRGAELNAKRLEKTLAIIGT